MRRTVLAFGILHSACLVLSNWHLVLAHILGTRNKCNLSLQWAMKYAVV